MVRIGRRKLLGGLALIAVFRANWQAQAAVVDRTLLAFLDGLPPYLPDDLKLLIGWATDAAAVALPLRSGDVIDRHSGLSRVPGFAAPTPVDGLSGRYRLLMPPYDAHDYYGLTLGLLDESDSVKAVIVANRLFRLPLILQEPLGLGSDLWVNAGLILGFGTAGLDAALAHADRAWDLAARCGAPLIATGQSQAGGTAQLQAARLAGAKRPQGRFGFVTFNANCSPASVRRLGVEPAGVPGLNFAKDLDPGVGPHALLANEVGLQVYIHADGTAGLTPRSSYLRALFHPREHFLDSFNGISLAAALKTVIG